MTLMVLAAVLCQLASASVGAVRRSGQNKGYHSKMTNEFIYNLHV